MITYNTYCTIATGTDSPYMCFLALEMWELDIQNNMSLKAAHMKGKINVPISVLVPSCPILHVGLGAWLQGLNCGQSNHGLEKSVGLCISASCPDFEGFTQGQRTN